jgi:hypothetical protein
MTRILLTLAAAVMLHVTPVDVATVTATARAVPAELRIRLSEIPRPSDAALIRSMQDYLRSIEE